MDLNIASFNCSGVSNILPIIAKICESHDIVLLQETWLMQHNLNILNSVHKDFDVYSISAVDCTEALVGRPYGGLSVLWRKTSNIVKICSFDDPRVLGIEINTIDKNFYVLNVYLPYYCQENYDLYLYYVGKISSLIECREHSDVMIFGDFNASVGSVFYGEWDQVCADYSLVFADVSL